MKTSAILALALLLCACTKPPLEPIKIGINPWPGYEFLYLAQEKGFYAELGVSVKIIEYGSLNDVRRGYERGNLDVMTSTLIEVLQVKNYSNRDPQIFLMTDFSYGGDVIIAKDPIKNLADLKGKRIAVDTTSLPIFILARALEKANLQLSDVNVIPIEQSSLVRAYTEGSIDAVVTYPPVSVQLERFPTTNTIFTSREIPGEVLDVVSAEADILSSRPDDFKKIRLAWDMALKYSAEHPEEANRIMGAREGITVDEFRDALNDVKTLHLKDQKKYAPQLKLALTHVKNTLVELGVLDNSVSSDCCVSDLLLE